VVTTDGARLEDLGSKNGTFVNGRRAEGPVPLADGDVVRVGTVKMAFRVIPPEAPTAYNRDRS
jgi:pSer/pThr/pTyr-binding forkhead associated (FHA) protein